MKLADLVVSGSPPSWDDLTSSEALAAAFEAKLGATKIVGRDRLASSAFRKRLSEEGAVIERKARADSYQFSPYLECLVTKGRGREPRVLSIPSIRDRIVLHQLKEYLHAHVPDAVRKDLPNEYIRKVKAALVARSPSDLSFVRADIKTFYDCIPHATLVDSLKARSLDRRVVELIRRAISTPTLPKTARRTRGRVSRTRVGVPQGLSVSNALANFYLHGLDTALGPSMALYSRYVDDILMIVPRGGEKQAKSQLRETLAALGLTLSEEKSYAGPLSTSFEYLGYSFTWPRVGVRSATVERYLHAVAAMVTKFRSRLRSGRLPTYLTREAHLAAFVDELNEKITGAVSETRRYGWLFYFSEINDLHLLHSMDHAIRAMVLQIEELGGQVPTELKRLVRAFYEISFSPERGYIHDYNSLTTVVDRLAFLERRGRVDPSRADQMTVAEIDEIFLAYREEQLSRFERDVGAIY